jgi:hypothetical protein
MSLLVVFVVVDDLHKQDREQDRRELAGSYTYPPTLRHAMLISSLHNTTPSHSLYHTSSTNMLYDG